MNILINYLYFNKKNKSYFKSFINQELTVDQMKSKKKLYISLGVILFIILINYFVIDKGYIISNLTLYKK